MVKRRRKLLSRKETTKIKKSIQKDFARRRSIIDLKLAIALAKGKDKEILKGALKKLNRL